jgi:hypothetical protein
MAGSSLRDSGKEMKVTDLQEMQHLEAYYLFICLFREVIITFWGQSVACFFPPLLHFTLFIFIFPSPLAKNQEPVLSPIKTKSAGTYLAHKPV